MPNRSADESERRAHHRGLVCVEAAVATGDNPEAVALIHDISSSGALLLTREKYAAGEPLELAIRAGGGPNGPTLTTGATVVRCEPISYSELWRYQIAVQFVEPLTSSDEQLDSLAKLIERVSRSKPKR